MVLDIGDNAMTVLVIFGFIMVIMMVVTIVIIAISFYKFHKREKEMEKWSEDFEKRWRF